MDPVGIPNLWKDEEAKVPVLIRSTLGVAQAGIAYGDVTAKYARNGDTSLQTQALDASKWTELGEGNYWMTIPSTVPNVAGPFLYQVATTATGNDTFIGYSRIELRPEDRVWDEAATGHVTDGSMADRFTDLETKINTVDTVVDAVKVKTDGLNFTGTDVKATLDGEEVALSAVSTNAVVDAVWDESVTGHTTAETMGYALDSADQIRYSPQCAMRYSQSDADACILAWLMRDGVIVAAPTSARVIAYDEDDNVTIDSTSVLPDSYGFFKITVDPLTLTALKAYRVRVIIVYNGTTYEAGEAFITFN